MRTTHATLLAGLLGLSLVALVDRAYGSDEQASLEYQAPPKELGPHAPMVQRWVPDLAFETLGGDASSLSKVAGERGLVIALRDPECPLSKRYSPRLVELEDRIAAAGLSLLYVNVSASELAAHDVETYGLGGTYTIDTGAIARALMAGTTTEVFVLDAASTLVYRGMIDDQYGLGFARPEPGRRYLVEALDALAAGESVRVPATEAQGCILEREPDATPASTEITYHNRVSRIVQNNCANCHRPGAVGPFSLLTYDKLKRKKSMIQWVLEDGIMPPWFAAEGSGPWANDMSLSAPDKADFLAWIAAGAPEGEPEDAPIEREWIAGWTIGEPDLVVDIPEPFAVPAEGAVQYQYMSTQLNLPEDKWVTAVEIRPGAAQVVHHVLVFLETAEVHDALLRDPNDRAARAQTQGGIDGYFACNVPGQEGLIFPEGTGKLLPKDGWLKFQLHYTPSGEEAIDRTQIGFIFSDEPAGTEIHTNSAYEQGFTIPPRAFDFEVSGQMTFREDAQLLSLFPHTHLRGVRFLYELTYPDGRTEDLLELPFYDFNWQLNYEFQSPKTVPAGTRLKATAWYDNSPENPANPDADQAVSFGEQTFEEMMIGYVNWIPSEQTR
ncbi:MAG: mono/diheme cytochrome c family protein [Chlamydiales bacterium]|jgi:mono/diheme cytochrome c family protein